MGIKLTFKKAGTRLTKEIDSDEILDGIIEVVIYSESLKLYKLKGRPKIILHQWVIEEQCKFKKAELNSIMKWDKEVRKEILEDFFQKEYIDSVSSKELFNEIREREILMRCGD